MTEQEKRRLYEEYTADDMRKLKQITLSQVTKYCGDANLHWDDYFSIANMTLWRVIETYDETKCNNFYAFLVDCLRRKFKTELTKINNGASVSTSTKTVSFDNVSDDGLVLAETIDSNERIEDRLDRRKLSENALTYVKQFNGNSRYVIEMIMDGYSNDEIQKALNLSRREFDDIMIGLRTYKNSSVLKRKEQRKTTDLVIARSEKNEEDTTMMGYSFNRNKTEEPTVRDIQERVEDGNLLLNYVLQRDENQWTVEGKSNQISDMLQMLPLPDLTFGQRDAENGTYLTFVVDGKQRITNTLSFMNDGFKISTKVRRWNIRYNVPIGIKDGIPQFGWANFDIRGKRFSDFPVELQKVLRSYQFSARVYLNCSDEDITYHITRYNDGKAMNSNQKSILRIGYDYASRIRKITEMPFFTDTYKTSEIQKGTPEKICVETIMASNYLDDWKKKNENNADYIAANSDKADFDSLEETIDRLSDVLDDNTRKIFTSKDCFIFLSVFNKFKELNLDDADKIFNDFLTEFPKMVDKVIGEFSWIDYLGMRNTKDKKIVSEKIDHVYTLLTEYISRNNDTAVTEDESIKESDEDDDDLFYVTSSHAPLTQIYDYKEDDDESEEKPSCNDHYRGDGEDEEAPDSVLDECDEEGTELPRLPREEFEEEPSWEDLLFDD